MTIDWDKLYLAYVWAKEWQILLAGLLVFFAALIFAWAFVRAAKLGAAARLARPQPDLRLAPNPISSPLSNPLTSSISSPATPAAQSSELISTLEQLRSLIRSALASLPPEKSETENNPATFLCQRILHLRLDQLPPPANAGKAAQDGYETLVTQLNLLRSHLKKNAPSGEISEVLVRINGSARSLVAALLAPSEKRRHVDR
ncbi:MAG TPA: hypothetical protein VJS85_09025 [Rhizomicrobium sp.]|nr:hypothetical protein [Rhizomicrobium sp.]